jgi:biofilm PGA synthesis N-glycosyltransferase PgaC
MLPIAIFLLSLLVLFYVLAGYPLLLAYVFPKHHKPVQRAPVTPSLSVIVPAYNGELYLASKLDSILALDYPRERLEIVIVSDGSTDRTEAIARSYSDRGVKLIVCPRGGKPAALNASIPQTSGEILVLTDVRQHLAPDSVRLLVQAFHDPLVGVVSGELRIRRGTSSDQADIGLYWRFETWIRNQLSAIDSMFGATGPFYAIRRELVVPIPPDTLLDDMFLPLSAFFQGRRLIVDSRALAFDFPTSRETEFQRKVRTLAGNYQLLMAMPALLSGSNRMLFHFLSYKFGRLLLPWCLISIALSSLFLPDPFRLISIAGQLACYALAWVDPWLSDGFPLKRISSPARTFLTMMLASLAGLKVFFVPARSLWKVTSTGPLGPK